MSITDFAEFHVIKFTFFTQGDQSHVGLNATGLKSLIRDRRSIAVYSPFGGRARPRSRFQCYTFAVNERGWSSTKGSAAGGHDLPLSSNLLLEYSFEGLIECSNTQVKPELKT